MPSHTVRGVPSLWEGVSGAVWVQSLVTVARPSLVATRRSHMGRVKCTDEEQINNLNRRASEAKLAARRKKLETVMKVRPSVIDGLWEKLQSMGYEDSWLTTVEAGPKSFQALAVENRRAKRSVDKVKREEEVKGEQPDSDDGGPDGSGGVALPVEPIPERARVLGDLTLAALRERVIGGLGYTNLSSANLRSLRDPDAMSKQGILRIIEFCAGKDSEYELKGKLRCYNRLTANFRELAEERGHRGLLLPLPPNWPDDGLATVVGVCPNDPSFIEICHRHTNEVIRVNIKDAPPHTDIKELYVNFNWSEQRLCLASSAPSASKVTYNLVNLFQAPRTTEEKPKPTGTMALAELRKRVMSSPVVKVGPDSQGSPSHTGVKAEAGAGDAAAGGLPKAERPWNTVSPYKRAKPEVAEEEEDEDPEGKRTHTFNEVGMAAPVGQ